MVTILTKNGYMVPKKIISEKKLKKIRKELNVKPVSNGDYGDDKDSFNVYTEDDENLYLPKFKGIELFGEPEKKNNLDVPDSRMKFKGKLRDYQVSISKKCLNWIKTKGGGIISQPCGRGKCLAKGTNILMADGNLKQVENIHINDLIMGDDSKPRKVLSLGRGKEEMYKIINKSDNTFYTVNKSHILSLKEGEKIVDISVNDILESNKLNDNNLKGYRVPVEFSEKEIDLDPYTLGYFLGFNNLEKMDILVNKIKNKAIINYLKVSLKNFSYEIEYNNLEFVCIKLNKFQKNKIPYNYKCNSRINRLKLLAGIIDSSNNFNSVFDKNFLNDIKFLVYSLGFNLKSNKNIYKLNGDYSIIPTLKKYINQFKSELEYDIEIKSIGIDNYYGFEIDGNRRFLLSDFSVTHNTVLGIYLAVKLKKPTLVIVHKTFLQDQWIERIKEFSNARIGIIRQNKVDVKNKDIVIGMIQSLSMREYDSTIFDRFGTIIVDEVHHAGSRIFSKSLQKISTLYTIGLSATPDRKDGLSKVFEWYLGDMIYKEIREKNKKVIVKIFQYESNDKLFKSKMMWVKGSMKPAIQKMLSNIIQIDKRNQFIIDIINTLRKEKDRKILILSGRILHLETLKGIIDKIIKKEENDNLLEEDEIKTAYYIGKMKPYELEDASTADIIFASYQMAEEGLDIKGLNTLIMSTSKTSVVQSVGRILRKQAKDYDIPPLIVDISDQFSVFGSQGLKRRKLYINEGYNIKYFKVHNNKITSTDESLKEILSNTSNEVDSNSHLDGQPSLLQTIDTTQSLFIDDPISDNNNNLNNNIFLEEISDEEISDNGIEEALIELSNINTK